MKIYNGANDEQEKFRKGYEGVKQVCTAYDN